MSSFLVESYILRMLKILKLTPKAKTAPPGSLRPSKD